jgi:hypothetical protein
MVPFSERRFSVDYILLLT